MSTVTPICPVEQEPEPRVVKALLDMLAEARAGRLRGILALSPDGFWSAGEMSLPDALTIFERWKLDELMAMRLQ